ncbi:MAG: putative metal-binding motif-containing protein [Myxococcales bacterium]|nr:putative metal-binding motif-containing protein [Myxococcales bacterium]
MVTLFLLHAQALGACTFSNAAPASGTVALAPPTFSATTTCTTVGLQYWPIANPANKQVLGPLASPDLTPPANQWSAVPAGSYAWRWVGSSASGAGVSTTQTLVIETDADHDGVSVQGGDCDDTDGAVHPGAAEVCNAIDDDCDGSVDPGPGAYTFDGVTLTSIDDTVNTGTQGNPTALQLVDEDLTFCPGTYHVALATSGDVGIYGTGNTVLEADGQYGVSQGGGTVRVEDVAIGGGAIGWFCAGGGNMVGRNLWIHDNGGSEGAGVYLAGCDGILFDSDLQRNAASSLGGAIKVTDGGYLELRDTLVRENSAGPGGGGGAAVLAGSQLVCRGSSFTDNGTVGGGAAVLADVSTFDMIGCDLGAVGAPDDNQGVDIVTRGGAYPANDGVTASCDAAGVCGAAVWTEPQNLSYLPNAVSQHADFHFSDILPVEGMTVHGASFMVKKTNVLDPACTAQAFLDDGASNRVYGPTVVVSTVPNQAIVTQAMMPVPYGATAWAGLRVDCGVAASSIDVGAGTGMGSILQPAALYFHGLLTTSL